MGTIQGEMVDAKFYRSYKLPESQRSESVSDPLQSGAHYSWWMTYLAKEGTCISKEITVEK